jgi:phage shock protein PspC (stress-responsive transcriptional regulator)
MIAGVCSGLASYFKVDTWIPRLVFVIPMFTGIFSHRIHRGWWWHRHWGIGPDLFMGSLGSTMFILYIVLWIALPYASSGTDKLKMRGARIDLNSIKSQAQAGAAMPPRRSYGIGRVIGIIFKAFFLFIAGTIALSLFGVLVGLLIAGFASFPLVNFVMGNWVQTALVWTGLILFLGIPMLALVTWIIRRLAGIRSHRHYLGYVFAGLWVIGLISLLVFTAVIASDFQSKSVIEETCLITQPSNNKLYINVDKNQELGCK